MFGWTGCSSGLNLSVVFPSVMVSGDSHVTLTLGPKVPVTQLQENGSNRNRNSQSSNLISSSAEFLVLESSLHLSDSAFFTHIIIIIITCIFLSQSSANSST